MLVANVASIYLRLRILLVVALLALVAGESAFAQDTEPAEQAAEAADSEASGQGTGPSENSGQDAAATSDTNRQPATYRDHATCGEGARRKRNG